MKIFNELKIDQLYFHMYIFNYILVKNKLDGDPVDISLEKVQLEGWLF